jgi:hypothetical protein
MLFPLIIYPNLLPTSTAVPYEVIYKDGAKKMNQTPTRPAFAPVPFPPDAPLEEAFFIALAAANFSRAS